MQVKKPIIECKQLSFQYDSQQEPTLQAIDVTIYEGETVLILGPSGSGKSTFGHLINGLIPNAYVGTITGEMTVGDLQVGKADIFSLSTYVGTVLQDTDGQFLGLTVAEDIAFALENEAVPTEQMHQQVQYWAEKVGLQNQLTYRPQDLSGGQKQRVSMAGVMIGKTPILLFDEPLANLDPAAGKQAMEYIHELKQELNATVIIIEHRLEDVLHCPLDRMLVFDQGRLVSDHTPAELLASDTLTKLGIREPLYISALKYAGVDLSRLSNLADIQALDFTQAQAQLKDWYQQYQATSPKITSTPLLRLAHIQAGYQQTPILKDMTTVIQKGEMTAIVGQNGAGKSTLIKLICGFLQPTAGTLLYKEEDFTKASIKERADKIGYVMQNPNQMISQTMIFDEVALGLRLRQVAEDEIKTRVYEALKICGLYPYRNWPIQALSYGQKKRVTIASMLVLQPEILILDEPTAGQDYAHYTKMMSFLESLNRQGITILMVTHDMHLMLEYTNRALVIVDGKLIADIQPADLLTNEALIEQASLKATSLYYLAKRIGLATPASFVQAFIDFERKAREQADAK